MNNTITIDLDKCFECGEPKQDMHHIIPKSKGGKKMIPLCAKCHGLVHGKDFVKHRILLLAGIKKAKEQGKFLGRKKGAIETNERLLSKHKDVVDYLLAGKKMREISSLTKKSSATIQKVRHIINDLGLIK